MAKYEGCYIPGPGGRCAANSSNCPNTECRQEQRRRGNEPVLVAQCVDLGAKRYPHNQGAGGLLGWVHRRVCHGTGSMKSCFECRYERTPANEPPCSKCTAGGNITKPCFKRIIKASRVIEGKKRTVGGSA